MKYHFNLLATVFSVCLFCAIFFINNDANASKTDNAISVINELLDEVSDIQKKSISTEQRRAEFHKLIYTFFDINIISI